MAEHRVSAHGASYLIEAHPESLVGRRLATGRPYEPILLEHIYQEGFEGLAVDVGAHIGNHALWLAAVCGLQVVAFEPLHYGWLADNVRLNQLEPKIRVESVALGDAPGQATDGGDRVLTSIESADERGRPSRSEGRLTLGQGPIEVRTLDSYGLQDVAVVKVDVEDMEPFVLRGGEQTIRRYGPVVFAEARDDVRHDAIAEVLEPWGYHVTQRFHRGTRVERWDRR